MNSIYILRPNTNSINYTNSRAEKENDISEVQIQTFVSNNRTYGNGDNYASIDFIEKSIADLVKSFYPEFEQEILSTIQGITILSGYTFEYEDIYNKWQTRYGKELSKKLLLHFANNNFTDDIAVCAVLHLLSHKPCEDFIDDFLFFITTCLSHKNKRDKKFALKVIDNWNNKNLVSVLSKLESYQEKWLEMYKETIIQDLEHK